MEQGDELGPLRCEIRISNDRKGRRLSAFFILISFLFAQKEQ
jgi:hypothetical protein